MCFFKTLFETVISSDAHYQLRVCIGMLSCLTSLACLLPNCHHAGGVLHSQKLLGCSCSCCSADHGENLQARAVGLPLPTVSWGARDPGEHSHLRGLCCMHIHYSDDVASGWSNFGPTHLLTSKWYLGQAHIQALALGMCSFFLFKCSDIIYTNHLGSSEFAETSTLSLCGFIMPYWS